MAAVSMLLYVALKLTRANPGAHHAFNNSDEINVNNGNAWGNWFRTAFYQVLWDPSDASKQSQLRLNVHHGVLSRLRHRRLLRPAFCCL